MPNNTEKSLAPETSESTREKIKLQLKHPDKIDLYEGGTMDVVDVKPEKLKTEVPVFWLRGWEQPALSSSRAIYFFSGYRAGRSGSVTKKRAGL
ncbi:MAG: hypothetical protein HYV53_04345 [Parcubacteria group bacterium]|nr:hypothetical protein [Parcubacteria group bacterium]